MRILLFSGKSGGKTSLAAATNVKLAELNHRTLIMSIDPAHSLADAFDHCSVPRCDGATVAKATAKGNVPTGIVATSLLLAVSITETVLSQDLSHRREVDEDDRSARMSGSHRE
jgi:hypothetical protein